jgi:uncharacterized protein
MRIFIDIGHPAHVHYFRNFIRLMQDKGHEFFISARDKEVSLDLLDKYNIPYFNRGKGSSNIFGKGAYLLKADTLIYLKAAKFRPDLFLSFASPYSAHVAKMLRKPHLAFTDTENARLGILSFAPVTECILTPSSFHKDFGSKHVRFNGFMELCYLHSNRYAPNGNVLGEAGLKVNEPFALLRFVSWGANHDVGQTGISKESKVNLVYELRKRLTVMISSEGDIPAEIQNHKLQISAEKMHDLLSFATIYIGEGATMASECAMLGTPAIYVNTLSSGTLVRQEKDGLLFGYRNFENVINKSSELLNNSSLKEEFQLRRQMMLKKQIDVTAFMVWFVENYPESFKIMKVNPDFQERFR